MMRWRLQACAAGALVAATAGMAAAHHSIGMFDQAHPVDIAGTVQDFQFVNPHSVIILEIKGAGAGPAVWRLEGLSANSLAWSGWSSKALKQGDQIRVTVEPLRSGTLGGSWRPDKVRFMDGSLVCPVEQPRMRNDRKFPLVHC